jgi:hypothetical protein
VSTVLVASKLKVDPQDFLAGLRRRRQKHANDLRARGGADTPNFGSWDEGVTTKRVGDRWVEVDDATAIGNIKRQMQGLVATYEQFTSQLPNRRFESAAVDGQTSDELMQAVAELFDLAGRSNAVRQE